MKLPGIIQVCYTTAVPCLSNIKNKPNKEGSRGVSFSFLQLLTLIAMENKANNNIKCCWKIGYDCQMDKYHPCSKPKLYSIANAFVDHTCAGKKYDLNRALTII